MRAASSGRSIVILPGALTLVLVALSSTAGCSWIFTQPLRDDRSPRDYPVCTTNPAPPVIDTTIFALNAGTTIYTAAQDNVSQKALRVSVGAAAATVWLLSAIYGYSKTSACREAIAAYDHGYRAPAFGTGGEVFTPLPPPSAREPGVGVEDPAHARPTPALPPPSQ
jgi:hypothetical protein